MEKFHYSGVCLILFIMASCTPKIISHREKSQLEHALQLIDQGQIALPRELLKDECVKSADNNSDIDICRYLLLVDSPQELVDFVCFRSVNEKACEQVKFMVADIKENGFKIAADRQISESRQIEYNAIDSAAIYSLLCIGSLADRNTAGHESCRRYFGLCADRADHQKMAQLFDYSCIDGKSDNDIMCQEFVRIIGLDSKKRNSDEFLVKTRDVVCATTNTLACSSLEELSRNWRIESLKTQVEMAEAKRRSEIRIAQIQAEARAERAIRSEENIDRVLAIIPEQHAKATATAKYHCQPPSSEITCNSHECRKITPCERLKFGKGAEIHYVSIALIVHENPFGIGYEKDAKSTVAEILEKNKCMIVAAKEPIISDQTYYRSDTYTRYTYHSLRPYEETITRSAKGKLVKIFAILACLIDFAK